MQGASDDGLRGAVRRHLATREGNGWPDEVAHLRDLLDLVERTMHGDHHSSRAANWRRLKRAIDEALHAAERGPGLVPGIDEPRALKAQ